MNVEHAQQKQKKVYHNRKSKGVKSFDLSIGQEVLKKDLSNVARKGGKMNPKWDGPYIITGFDKHQRVTLTGAKGDVRGHVPYDQLKPYLSHRETGVNEVKGEAIVISFKAKLQSI